MDDVYTTDLSEFRPGELEQAVNLLQKYKNKEFNINDDQKGIMLVLNKHTCEVFLINKQGKRIGILQ